MNRNELIALIRERKSFLCVGLDSDPIKLPGHLKDCEDPVFEFNKQIIDATIDFAVAYKPNLAFYETRGIHGWLSLEKTLAYLRSLDQSSFVIADAKRGDIGNTSTQYARAFFDAEAGLEVDAVTVAPYMGEDSVRPFLEFNDKWVILLALTSNKGSADFQFSRLISDDGREEKLFERVLQRSKHWGHIGNMMYVVGATQAAMLKDIRKIIPEHFLLVPGVGAQGGSLEEVARFGMNNECGLLVNASRSILFASSGEDFAVKAREEALKMQSEMQVLLETGGVL